MTIDTLKSKAEKLGFKSDWEQDEYLHDCYIESKFDGNFSEWLDFLES